MTHQLLPLLLLLLLLSLLRPALSALITTKHRTPILTTTLNTNSHAISDPSSLLSHLLPPLNVPVLSASFFHLVAGELPSLSAVTPYVADNPLWVFGATVAFTDDQTHSTCRVGVSPRHTWGYRIPLSNPAAYDCTLHFPAALLGANVKFDVSVSGGSHDTRYIPAIQLVDTELSVNVSQLIVQGTLSLVFTPVTGRPAFSALSCKRSGNLPRNVSLSYSIPSAVQSAVDAAYDTRSQINVNLGGPSFSNFKAIVPSPNNTSSSFLSIPYDQLLQRITNSNPEIFEILNPFDILVLASNVFIKDTLHLSIPLFEHDPQTPQAAVTLDTDEPQTPSDISCNLYFTEINPAHYSVASRVFDLHVNGALLRAGVDVFAQGSQKPLSTVVHTVNNVSSDVLNITLIPVTGSPFISAVSCRKADALGASSQSAFSANSALNSAEESPVDPSPSAESSADPFVTAAVQSDDFPVASSTVEFEALEPLPSGTSIPSNAPRVSVLPSVTSNPSASTSPSPVSVAASLQPLPSITPIPDLTDDDDNDEAKETTAVETTELTATDDGTDGTDGNEGQGEDEEEESAESSPDVAFPLAQLDEPLQLREGENMTTYILTVSIFVNGTFSQPMKETMKEVCKASNNKSIDWALTVLTDMNGDNVSQSVSRQNSDDDDERTQYSARMQATYSASDMEDGVEAFETWVRNGNLTRAMNNEGYNNVDVQFDDKVLGSSGAAGASSSTSTSLIVIISVLAVLAALIALAVVAYFVSSKLKTREIEQRAGFDAPPPGSSSGVIINGVDNSYRDTAHMMMHQGNNNSIVHSPNNDSAHRIGAADGAEDMGGEGGGGVEGTSGVMRRDSDETSIEYLDDDESTYTAATSRADDFVEHPGYIRDTLGRGTTLVEEDTDLPRPDH